MKILAKILLSVLALLLLSGIGGYFYFRKMFEAPANQFTVMGLPATLPFVWDADTVARPAVPHAAMLVPVVLPNCPRTCYMQFDTGAPTSLLYAKALAALREQYPATSRTLLPQQDSVRDFHFSLGQAQVVVRRFRTRPMGAQQVPADSIRPLIIGTLGADVMDGRVLTLDFPHQKFSLSARVPDSLARRTAFVPMTFTSRRVQFPVGLQGKTEQMLFDSGSSAFALITSQPIWKKLARPAAPFRTANSNSMGRTLTTHTADTEAAMQLGTVSVPLRTVTYIEGTKFMESVLMRFSGMGGMLGNEPFSNRTIVMDVAGSRFGVVQ